MLRRSNRQNVMLVASCLSASIARESNPDRIKDNPKGRVTTALQKFMPHFVRRVVHEVVHVDELPFPDYDRVPLSYGEESIVWRVHGKEQDYVCKIDRQRMDYRGEYLTPEDRQHDEDLMRDYFGNMVVPNQLCIVRQPYVGGESCTARIQPYIEVEKDLFDCTVEELAILDRDDREIFLQGLVRGLVDGTLPDCVGSHNIVTSSDRHIFILDTNYPPTKVRAIVWQQAAEKANRLIPMLEESLEQVAA